VLPLVGGYVHHWAASLILLGGLFALNATTTALEEFKKKEKIQMIAATVLNTARDLSAALLASAVVDGLGRAGAAQLSLRH
jgi:hypothetical protein